MQRQFFLKLENGENRHAEVISARAPTRIFFLIKLAGLTDIDQAETLRGADIYISKRTLVREKGRIFLVRIVGAQRFFWMMVIFWV